MTEFFFGGEGLFCFCNTHLHIRKDGYKQETLGQMWGVPQSQISYIVGADERTEKISPGDNSKQKLTPKHERIIRRAPEKYQDQVASAK